MSFVHQDGHQNGHPCPFALVDIIAESKSPDNFQISYIWALTRQYLLSGFLTK